MQARVTVFGHPLHQVMISLPIGLFSGAMIFDVVYLITRSLDWPALSYWLIFAGVLSGLAAAIFGFLDWRAIPAGTRAKRVGRLHGLGNVAVVALFTASWFARGEAGAVPSMLGLSLSFAAVVMLMVTGWMGGELVGRLAVGVDDGANVDAPSSLSGRPASG